MPIDDDETFLHKLDGNYMPINEEQRRKEWEALLIKNDSSYYRDNNGQIRRLKANEYIDQYGNLQKRYGYYNELINC